MATFITGGYGQIGSWIAYLLAKEGEDVIITGHVLTDVTQTAANIETKTNIKNKDHRVFLDGIYVFEKTKGIESGKPDKK